MTSSSTRARIRSDTFSIGELFSKTYVFGVPDYQRDYAWTTEEAGELWSDIKSAFEKGKEEYFLGTIVISEGETEKHRDIVDGQQRMATLSMIFAAIRNAWRVRIDEKAPQADQVSGLYLGKTDRKTQKISPKLSLNKNNSKIFQTLVLDNERAKIPLKKSKTDKLLELAFLEIEKKVFEFLGEADKDETAALLSDLEEFVAEKVHVILIETVDDSDAFIIFETLNDRGMDLAVSDLVKNFLFSRAGKRLDEFMIQWKTITSDVGSTNVTSFLRHVWLSKKRLIREKELYRAIRKEYSTDVKVASYLDELTRYAYFYEALNSPTHQYWSDFNTFTRENIDALNKFKLTQFIPVAFAAMETEDKDLITDIINALTIISFRYTIISTLGTGNLEKMYNDAALKIREDGPSSSKEVLKVLAKAYVEDTEMIKRFVERDFTKNEIARYILIKINTFMSDDKLLTVTNFGDATLEHIMPKKLNEEWRRYIKEDEHEELVFRIGNLTILDKEINRKVSNSYWTHKKSHAIDISGLAINQPLKDLDSWSAIEINARSQELAEKAAKIWKIDFQN